MDWAAIDVGTSFVKGARFSEDGTRHLEVVQPMPPLERASGGVVEQSLPRIRAIARSVRDRLAGPGALAGIALTTQRDTVATGDRLVSWMDGRDPAGPLWDSLQQSAPREPVSGLPGALLLDWTGRAAETDAAWSSRVRVDVLKARGLAVCDRVELGQPAGRWNGIPCYPTAGDKNCALFANGASAGVAGLSLGSAVSLGIRTTHDRLAPLPGAFISTGATGHRDVETGVIAGMSARGALQRWFGEDAVGDPSDGDGWVDDLWVLPLFAGALDRPATGAVVGLTPRTPSRAIVQAWRQGVVAELARLRGVVEAVGRAHIARVRLSGGGAVDGWATLVANGLSVPVDRVHGAWAGCRGAVDAVRVARGLDPLPPVETFATVEPDAAGVKRFRAWNKRYTALVEAIYGMPAGGR